MTSNTTVLVTPSSRMLEQWLSVQLMHRWFYSAGAVIEVFVRLHDKGLIYQGTMIYHRQHAIFNFYFPPYVLLSTVLLASFSNFIASSCLYILVEKKNSLGQNCLGVLLVFANYEMNLVILYQRTKVSQNNLLLQITIIMVLFTESDTRYV